MLKPRLESDARPPRPAEIDGAIVARASRGDPAACRVLVERFERPVFAVLSRLLRPAGRQDRVEDLAQECFLRVFRSLPRFDPKGPAKLSTWILTIASRLAIDELRRPALAAGALLDVDTLSGPAVQEKVAAQREQLRRVAQALDELSPEYRAALALRLFHEQGYEQIAAALGIELGTVKSRLARARAALARALGEGCHADE